MKNDLKQHNDFEAIRLGVASPDKILEWSHGEVTKPETINYRTQKPEKDGLFCERTFGPSKDWECYCGKYKRIQYKGIVCDKCGVEVTRSIVRRERMGHIKLAAPVSHIWFLRGVPSKVGLVLDLGVQALEKVVYFANFIVTEVDEELRDQALAQIDEEFRMKKQELNQEGQVVVNEIKKIHAEQLGNATTDKQKEKVQAAQDQELINAAVNRDEAVKDLEDAVEVARNELKELQKYQIISEQQYQDLSLKYGHVFEAGIGAEAIRQLLIEIDLDQKIVEIEAELEKATKNRQRRLMRRLKLFKNLKSTNIRPEWMILEALPVIPPDLRPMVQLDGGRYAASDLNDLYRRVINRNNRLKKLNDLNAPEVIKRNEKRMLQEAVDALIDNSARHGKTVTAASGQKRQLKSMADMLKGKQGRFRQNLLGKRVDYSGRSVIVVGPHLKLNECGLPKKMALELFKPFVIAKLIEREYVHNVRSATRYIEARHPEVWDILEEVTKDARVLLNRAPTLHRLGIQAFKPVLIEGLAIQVHPLVCTAFNADFDGDQMAVHVPLTEMAKWEAENIMESAKNLLKPATGDPIVSPSQDIVLGAYYLTQSREADNKDKMRAFASANEAILALESGALGLQDEVKIRVKGGEILDTTVGRVIFNNELPEDLPYVNEAMDKGAMSNVIHDVLVRSGMEQTVELLDSLKELSFKYLTKSGMSWGMSDLPVPAKKKEILEGAEKEVDEVLDQFDMGLLTEDERHVRVTDIWTRVKNEITEEASRVLDPFGPVLPMIKSKARGSWGQLTQMVGMKGLVTNPAGDIIELPVKKSFKEGFDVLEFFISTHGTRKGLSDTALRTANAGYLTRRLVDVAQDMVIMEEDCGEKEGIVITKAESEELASTVATRVWGRVVLDDVKKGKKVLVKAGDTVDRAAMAAIEEADIEEIRVRAVLTCQSVRGLCQQCYGFDLGRNDLVRLGTAVGIVAAQSIGEPGTQLTMRTFHTGGVVGSDITQGLPRVEELFEARPVKKPAIIAEFDGKVKVTDDDGQRTIYLTHKENQKDTVRITKGGKLNVKDGDSVKQGDVMFVSKAGSEKIAEGAGTVNVTDKQITLLKEVDVVEEYPVPDNYSTLVKNGELVTAGQHLTEGSLDLQQVYRLSGATAVERYILKEIQYIYSSQGQKLNDKHIEVIIRQMFSRYFITDPGSTDLIVGNIVSREQFMRANIQAKEEGNKAAKAENLLLGITKASLSTDSFLSAASFQETARVLIDAAVSGKVDTLRGLKENVIIGKLIPVGTGFGLDSDGKEIVEAENTDESSDEVDEAKKPEETEEKTA